MPPAVLTIGHSNHPLEPFLALLDRHGVEALVDRAASPGGSSAQPSGAFRTVPSAARTVFGVGPGVKAHSVIVLTC